MSSAATTGRHLGLRRPESGFGFDGQPQERPQRRQGTTRRTEERGEHAKEQRRAIRQPQAAQASSSQPSSGSTRSLGGPALAQPGQEPDDQRQQGGPGAGDRKLGHGIRGRHIVSPARSWRCPPVAPAPERSVRRAWRWTGVQWLENLQETEKTRQWPSAARPARPPSRWRGKTDRRPSPAAQRQSSKASRKNPGRERAAQRIAGAGLRPAGVAIPPA
jgi:hypothetical protein